MWFVGESEIDFPFLLLPHLVQQVGAGLSERVVRLAPARHHPDLALQRVLPGRQADGDDIFSVVDGSVEPQEGHVKPVGLGQHVPEVRVQGDARHGERLRVEGLGDLEMREEEEM